MDYTNVLRAIREDYPRAADLPGPGFAAGPVPVQGHDAAGRLHQRPLPAGPGGDAGQRGSAGLHRRPRSSAATADSRARPSASSGWPSRPSRTTPAPRCSYKLRKLLRGPARASCAPTRTSRTIGCAARVRPRGERHPGPRRAAQGVPRPADRRQGRRRCLGRPGRRDRLYDRDRVRMDRSHVAHMAATSHALVVRRSAVRSSMARPRSIGLAARRHDLEVGLGYGATIPRRCSASA